MKETRVIFNPLDKFYKSVTGAVGENTQITFRVRSSDSVVFVYEKDSDGRTVETEMDEKDGFRSCTLKFAPGLYFYYFKRKDGKFISRSGTDSAKITERLESKFQLTAYSEDFSVPEWLKGGVIYQIFPDRFNGSGENLSDYRDRFIHKDKADTPIFLPDENGKVRNTDFFGGDLKGIAQKTDYLKELGVTAIYLNPIFDACSNHRYDTGDYMKIDRFLGSIDGLKELIRVAKEKGIKIILDGVFNHTGDDSRYFNKYGSYDCVGAYQSKDSPYYKWYKFINYPDLYESWWGVDVLPATDKNNADFINFITGDDGVLERYLKLGIGGWRLDVVDELPDGFVKKIRERVKKVNPDAVIIGEVWEDASNKISYGVRREYFQGAELDSVMNYPLKDAIINYVKSGNSRVIYDTVTEQIDHYPKTVLDGLMNILATHDTFRLLSALGDTDVSGLSKSEMSETVLSGESLSVAVYRLKRAVLLQYTLYGVPSVYYGDEAGMQGYRDPLNRKYFDWNNINNGIRDFYVALGKIRSDFPCFKDGDTRVLYAEYGLFVFTRENRDCEVLVAVNAGDGEFYLDFDGELTDVLTDKTYKNRVNLSKGEYGIFIKKF